MASLPGSNVCQTFECSEVSVGLIAGLLSMRTSTVWWDGGLRRFTGREWRNDIGCHGHRRGAHHLPISTHVIRQFLPVFKSPRSVHFAVGFVLFDALQMLFRSDKNASISRSMSWYLGSVLTWFGGNRLIPSFSQISMYCSCSAHCAPA